VLRKILRPKMKLQRDEESCILRNFIIYFSYKYYPGFQIENTGMNDTLRRMQRDEKYVQNFSQKT
jgi:hypothetical protein